MAAGIAALLASCHSQNQYPLIPEPQEIQTGKGQIMVNPAKDIIQVVENPAIPDEGYILNISKNNIQLAYNPSSDAGLFYARQTMRQLDQDPGESMVLPLCRIEDYPAFKVRGFMLDVGRNFQEISTLKRILDRMAFYKMNTFHWHLTDRPAWRIESKIYPELTEAKNHRPSRDPGKYYTYAEIRDLINYAQQLHIQVIPEIDMPGHSDSFITATGVRMESPEGMSILENILKEFFEELPATLVPIIHLGSDEVHIPDPEGFISKMTNICQAHQREVVIWNPGLPANEQMIRQTWQAKHLEAEGYREIDSWNSYLNNMDPLNAVSRLFFKPIGYGSDNKIIGGILCLWPDVNVDDPTDAFRANPIYPALLSYAQSCWTGHQQEPFEEYLTQLPDSGTAEAKRFAEFEGKLAVHHEKFLQDEFFFYAPQNQMHWKIALRKHQHPGDTLSWKPATGGTIIFKDRFKLGGYFRDAEPGDTAYAKIRIQSSEEKSSRVLIGFETPLRANRTYGGVPLNGSWDIYGGKVYLNGEELKGPEWDQPGWKPSKSDGWGTPEEQEIPWRNEELYWLRKPVELALQKGQNIIEFRVPYKHIYQNWMISFIPLDDI